MLDALARGAPALDAVAEAARHWKERYPATTGFHALTSLVRTYNIAVRGVEGILRPLGLNLSRFELLLLLSFTRTGSLPTMRLRDLLMMHGSSVTYLVDRLEEAGWVTRGADASDGRVSLVAITEEGRAVVDRAAATLIANDFGSLGGLSDEQRGELSALLAELR